MLTSGLINTRTGPLFLIEDSYLSGPAGLGEMWSPGLGVGEVWSLLLNVLSTVPRGPLCLFTVTSKTVAPWCPGITPVEFPGPPSLPFY